MTSHPIPTNSLSEQLSYYAREQFNGRVHIQHPTGLAWELYFCLGRFVWATGGDHPIRRLHRYIGQYCPQIDRSSEVLATPGMRCWDYFWLTGMARRQRISREQGVAVIEHVLAEVLFDILHCEVGSLTYTSDLQKSLDTPLAVIQVERALQASQQVWEAWCNAGLADRSPNLVPVLQRHEQLRAAVSEAAYQNLRQLIDGQRTLRDLALMIKQDVLLTTRSLLPYITKGLIGLVEIADLAPDSSALGALAELPTQSIVKVTDPAVMTSRVNDQGVPQQRPPLVVCIDDSPLVGQVMQQLLSPLGIHCQYIADSLTAIPQLLQQKPDLIFLDLVMPVANGYEVCTQIRRISAFRHIPIIILTSNDGIVDRVRAKMVGSSDFLSKPVDRTQLLELIQKYLHLDPPPAPHSQQQPQRQISGSPPLSFSFHPSFAKGIS